MIMNTMEILKLLKKGKDPVPIALQRGMTVEEIRGMLSQLEGAGYIERIRTDGDPCERCNKKGVCLGAGHGIGLYTISEKGRKTLR